MLENPKRQTKQTTRYSKIDSRSQNLKFPNKRNLPSVTFVCALLSRNHCMETSKKHKRNKKIKIIIKKVFFVSLVLPHLPLCCVLHAIYCCLISDGSYLNVILLPRLVINDLAIIRHQVQFAELRRWIFIKATKHRNALSMTSFVTIMPN